MDQTEVIHINPEEVEIQSVRSQGPGGQNVNKVATAIHLRFNIRESSLDEAVREKLLNCGDRRVTREGVVVMKAQRFRTREKNLEDAFRRLNEFVALKCSEQRPRKATKPSKASGEKRIDKKKKQGRAKALRRRVEDSE